MSEQIIYCDNGCNTNGHPKQTEHGDHLCSNCDNQLRRWLNTIPDNYALLHLFIEHGTVERNPESQVTKRPTAPAPMRLEIIDLLDERLGRKWLGIAPTNDRRGALGTLKAHLDHIADDRHLTNVPTHPTVTEACRLLQRHRIWVIQQDWAHDFFTEIKQLNRDLSDAIGDYQRPPVGHCHVEHETGRCNGPLFANPYGGVRCVKCGAVWDATHLRQLGLAQAETA